MHNSAKGRFVPVFAALLALLGGCGYASQQAEIFHTPVCELAAFAANYANFPDVSSSQTTAQQWQPLACSLKQLASVKQAQQIRWAYVDKRAERFAVVGYKIALGSNAAQRLFGLQQPVVGVLFNDTLINAAQNSESNSNGVSLPRSAGVNIAYEPDLLVVIKSAAINAATSIAEVAPHIESVAAFLEVPDLVVMPEVSAGPAFIASNAAVRWGVMGDVIKASSDPVFLDSLQTMQVTAYDQSGIPLSTAPGSAVMGHPYNAIVFLLDQLRKNGRQLRAGDRISLGAFAPPKPAAQLDSVTVEYIGLGSQPLSVSASFTD